MERTASRVGGLVAMTAGVIVAAGLAVIPADLARALRASASAGRQLTEPVSGGRCDGAAVAEHRYVEA